MQFLQQRQWVEQHKARAALLVFQFGNAQQAAKARHQGVGFGDHLVQLRGLARAFGSVLLHAVELGAQAGQRGTQVVGDVVADTFDFVDQALDAFEHGVDDSGQHVQFVASAGQR
ncbi:hypothetical protein D3C71_1504970 [compost metagenome]